jgi:cysteine desulfurase
MLANNEIGTIQPVAAIAQAARERGILMHTDAVQAAGVVSLDIRELGVDLMSLTAHKVYGPKGVGVLVARRGVDLLPLVSGGDQESGRRAGTENVAGIVGCGAAFELVEAHREATVVRLSTLRNRLMAGIEQRVPEAILNGDRQQRLPGNANYCFPGTQGETILLELEARNVYVASGSACHAGSTDPSHVLLAIGRSPELAHTAVRFSLGAPTTEADINAALDALVAAVAAVRGRV